MSKKEKSRKGECPLHTLLSTKQLDDIASEHAKGVTPETLASRFRVDYDEMTHHVEKCLGSADEEEESKAEVLRRMLKALLELVELARDAYEEDTRRHELLMGVNDTMRSVRETLKHTEESKDPETLLDTIVAKVLNPMIQAGLKGVAMEWSKQREELQKAGVKREVLDTIMGSLALAYGQHMNQALQSSVTALGAELGLSRRKVQALLATWVQSRKPKS